jgi:hypothetical protein
MDPDPERKKMIFIRILYVSTLWKKLCSYVKLIRVFFFVVCRSTFGFTHPLGVLPWKAVSCALERRSSSKQFGSAMFQCWCGTIISGQMRIRIQIQGFDYQKLWKFTAEKKIVLYLSLSLHKGRARYRGSLYPWKENIQPFKTWNFFNFILFLLAFLPSWIRIRILIRNTASKYHYLFST